MEFYSHRVAAAAAAVTAAALRNELQLQLLLFHKYIHTKEDTVAGVTVCESIAFSFTINAMMVHSGGGGDGGGGGGG